MSTDKQVAGTLDEWLDLIRRQSMPIFDQTVRRVIAVSGNDLAPMSELAGVILQDASMTARVLRLASSVLYNPTAAAINTVTRAVIVLGLNAVRNICLTLTLIDTLVKGEAREHLARELARTMHAAVQARGLAAARGDSSPEEVFIAALLLRIGELAFWSFGGEKADHLDHLIRSGGLPPEQAQEQVLGFRLGQLSRQLVREWRLTELLQEVMNHPTRRDLRTQSVTLGHQIARCAELHGWRSDEMSALIHKAAKLSEFSEEETRDLLYGKARMASRIAVEYGAAFAVPHIPQPLQAELSVQDPETEPATDTLAAAEPLPPQRDNALQIKILREIETIMAGAQCNFNVLMELVLEGIFRGVGMDRVVFALTTPDRGALRAKYALGPGSDALAEGFCFVRPNQGLDIFFQTMDHKRPHLVTRGARADLDTLIPESLTELTGPASFMVAPIIVENLGIGLFYADRGISHRALDATSFDDFKHFVHKANMGLTMAALRRRQ